MWMHLFRHALQLWKLDFTTSEQILCETPAGHEGCMPMDRVSRAVLVAEETPYISWISGRALSAGDQIAFGAADPGALIEIGSFICDGQAELPPAFLDGDFKPYARTAADAIHKLQADLQENVSCIDFEVFVGGSPFAGTKSIQYNANVMEIASCAKSEMLPLALDSAGGCGDVKCGRAEAVSTGDGRDDIFANILGRMGNLGLLGLYTKLQRSVVVVQLLGLPPLPHRDALRTCELKGMRLCTRMELNSGICCSADCSSSDGTAAWTSDEGYLQELVITADDGEPWEEELWIRCEEKCRLARRSFPFNVTYPDPGNETTTTTTKYSPAEIALWEFAPWLRPDDYIPPEEQGPVPLGPPVPEPLRPFESPHLLAPFAGNRGLRYSLYANPDNLPVHRSSNAGYPQSPLMTGTMVDVLRGALTHVKFDPVPQSVRSAKRTYAALPQLDRARDVAVEGKKTKGVGAEHSRGDAAVHGRWAATDAAGRLGKGHRAGVREFVGHGRGPLGTKRSASAERKVAGPPLMDDTGHDFYAEEITGFFVAPYTANYSFYLAADDEADLSLSCCGDMAGMKVIVRSEKVDFAMPRYTPLAWYGSDRVLMRVRHRDHVAAESRTANSVFSLLFFEDWLRVGLRVHMPIQSAEGSMPHAEIVRKSFIEVQRLTMTANVVRERHRMNFLRVLTGSFRVRVRRFAQNFLREGVSGVLRVGATAAELAQTLWDTMDARAARVELEDLYGRVLECEPTLERTEDADNAEGMERPRCEGEASGGMPAEKIEKQDDDALDIVPGLDVIATGREGWVMNSAHLQSASELAPWQEVQGSFRLHFRGQWTEAISYQGWQDVQRQLLMLPGLGDVRIWPFAEVLQEGREGWSVGLLLPGESGGGEDMPQIHVDGSRLSGPGVRLSIDTLANGSQDLFFEVVVESNGVVASADDVSFRRSEDFTPRLMDLDPLVVQVGSELSLRFDRVETRLDGNHLRDVTLREGSDEDLHMASIGYYEITNIVPEIAEDASKLEATESFPEVWNVMCTVLDGRAGDQEVQVIVDAQGQAQYTNVTIAMCLGCIARLGGKMPRPMPSIGFVPQIDLAPRAAVHGKLGPAPGDGGGSLVAGQCGAWSRVVLLSGPFQIPQSPLQTTAIRDREEEFCIAAEEENQALLVAEAGGTVVVIVGSGLQGPEACQLLTFGNSSLLEVSTDVFEAEGPSVHGAACRTHADGQVLSVSVAGYALPTCLINRVLQIWTDAKATDWNFTYSRSLTPLVDAVVRVAGQRCRIEVEEWSLDRLAGSDVFILLPEDIACQHWQPNRMIEGTAAQIELKPQQRGTSIDDSFAVSEVTPKHGSLHGGVTLDVSREPTGGYGFDADPMRHEIFIRVAMSNGTIQDLPCPLRPAASLQGRRLKCEAPSLPPELLHYTRKSRFFRDWDCSRVLKRVDMPSVSIQQDKELLGRVIVRLNGIESSCSLPMDAELSPKLGRAVPRHIHQPVPPVALATVFRLQDLDALFCSSGPVTLQVTPLEGATLEHEAPLVRIVVAGWDGAHGSDLAQVFFGSQECEVNFTKRLVQPCVVLSPDCGSGHCADTSDGVCGVQSSVCNFAGAGETDRGDKQGLHEWTSKASGLLDFPSLCCFLAPSFGDFGSNTRPASAILVGTARSAGALAICLGDACYFLRAFSFMVIFCVFFFCVCSFPSHLHCFLGFGECILHLRRMFSD
ncbi:unnamed protein product [Symbiodinium microadriaticum]|nr:unnamed protein product [Symbiodinium microadriaticum]